jgi:DNA-binding GntR family transcriptional regulator
MTSTAERVYADVRDKILDGHFRGGDVLSEVELAAEFGVSRTPVHEAFVRLEADEFLSIRARRGAVVVPVPPHEARDILELRHALETAAARRLARDEPAADQGRAQLAEQAEALLAEQARHAASGDVARFAAADQAFHRAIVEASGNVLALRAYTAVSDRHRRLIVGAVGGRPDHLTTLVVEHRRLALLVDRRDAAAFETELLEHLAATHDTIFGFGTAR